MVLEMAHLEVVRGRRWLLWPEWSEMVPWKGQEEDGSWVKDKKSIPSNSGQQCWDTKPKPVTGSSWLGGGREERRSGKDQLGPD
jgi:hypothetical protein